jgi:hypothetical protein
VVRAQREPPFHERFKKYIPSPDLKIAVGDAGQTADEPGGEDD